MNDVHLVDHLAANIHPDDGLILSSTGAFLVAFYGHWPVTIDAVPGQIAAGSPVVRRLPHCLYRVAGS